jgi:abortive infection bacteriophage resistance protein
MSIKKPFLTYDQQIAKLRDKRLIIAHIPHAIEMLTQIGYFSLIIDLRECFKNAGYAAGSLTNKDQQEL